MKSIINELDEILIDTGKYPNKDELMKDALRALLRAKPELKRELAVELYKKGTVSLSKAAEIYGSDMEDFKELLKERGMKIAVPCIPAEEIDKEIDYILSQ
jgi:predicted HTH domain antitoxin